jgi:hypothetical protein
MVEEMLTAPGIIVSHETVRQWAGKFGPIFANVIRRRLPFSGDKWHLDELVTRIAGQPNWLWRAVDQNEQWLEQRHTAAALPATSFGDCRAPAPGRKLPEIHRSSLRKAARTLCFQAFSVIHSGAAGAPLVSSTLLTPDGVRVSASLERVDVFHAQRRLPRAGRGELEDYRGNRLRLDRGSMTASADAPALSAQAETFSLANIVPQAANLNRGGWAEPRAVDPPYGAPRVRLRRHRPALRRRAIADNRPRLVPTAVW